MANDKADQIAALMLAQLPADGSNIGNGALIDAMRDTDLGQALALTDDDFHDARARLLAAELARKGKGRGGSTARLLADEAGPGPGLTMAQAQPSADRQPASPAPKSESFLLR